jgi:hypothetical protein
LIHGLHGRHDQTHEIVHGTRTAVTAEPFTLGADTVVYRVTVELDERAVHPVQRLEELIKVEFDTAHLP